MPGRMMLRAALCSVVYLFALLVALLVLPPVVPVGSSIGAPEDRWRLNPPYVPDVQAQLASIMAANLWGSTAPTDLPVPLADEPALTPPNWRIGGVYTVAGRAVAVVTVPGRPDLQVKVGDQFPGGAKILAISPDRIDISLRGKRLFISTYQE